MGRECHPLNWSLSPAAQAAARKWRTQQWSLTISDCCPEVNTLLVMAHGQTGDLNLGSLTPAVTPLTISVLLHNDKTVCCGFPVWHESSVDDPATRCCCPTNKQKSEAQPELPAGYLLVGGKAPFSHSGLVPARPDKVGASDCLQRAGRIF